MVFLKEFKLHKDPAAVWFENKQVHAVCYLLPNMACVTK